MKELTLEATIENIAQVTDFVNVQLDAVPCEIKVRRLINVAIDEVFSNIAYYAYAPQTGMATIRVEMLQDPQAVEITFMDAGTPFNPLTQAPHVDGLPGKEHKAGGLGIYIVRKSMDNVCYEHIDGCNVTKITKRLQPV